RYYELLSSKELDDILDAGAKQANAVASETLRRMETAIGLHR
ncbi:MAG: tryptophan--tRNA ligase, partial [Trichococcus flocculiformis]